MTFRSDMRKLIVPLAAIIAIVAVIVPTCQMVGCSGAMRFVMPFAGGTNISAPTGCGGMFVYTSAPPAVSSSGAAALLLTLLVALAVGVSALLAPRFDLASMGVVRIEPPPPPDDPRGERLRV